MSHVVDACDGADLLIHETFPAPATFAAKTGVPLDLATMIVDGAHTSPTMAGKVFALSGARMSAFWHLALDHETVGPVFEEMRKEYEGPVTASQDLTVFNVAKEAVVVRQATLDPVAWPVVGTTKVTGPPATTPHGPPAWWADALIT